MTPRRQPRAELDRRPVRVLYLMHVDWHWIRQRPHAIAEEFDRMPGFTVFVAYMPNWRRGHLSSNASDVRRAPIPQLPFSGRLALVRWLNTGIARTFLTVLGISWRPDLVVVPYPTMYEAMPHWLRSKPLVYDCMDLATGFAVDPGTVERRRRVERKLVERAALVTVSSAFLAEAVGHMLPEDRQPVLIRNGVEAAGPRLRPPEHAPGAPIRLAYFGTISRWLAIDLVLDLLAAEPDVELHLWGPLHVDLPAHPRLAWHGVVPHDQLPTAIAEAHADALIMPFVVTELIQGVDPVKLYEYVALGRPVLTVYYPELEQFRGVVNFFAGLTELRGLVAQLRTEPQALEADPQAAAAFLAAASWGARAEAMAAAIRRVVQAPARGDILTPEAGE